MIVRVPPAAASQTPLGRLRHGKTTCATAAILVLTAGLFGPCAAADITIDSGTFSAVAVSPDGRAIAAAIDGSGDQGDDPTVVRWWNWNGMDGSWHVPSYRVGALAWAADGSLLVGGMMETRFPEVPWWRLGAGGAVRAECRGLPIGPGIARLYPMRRGVASITELTGGQVVTGGIDPTLAVWEGCAPTWLISGETCCYAEHPVTVTALGMDFVTSGEGVWEGEERGYSDLGPRRWSASPWKAVPVQARAATAELHYDGVDCTATMDASGRIAVAGAQPWTASIGAGAWFSLAASRDCKTLVAASEQRIVKLTSP
jgi:hypothetical protein